MIKKGARNDSRSYSLQNAKSTVCLLASRSPIDCEELETTVRFFGTPTALNPGNWDSKSLPSLMNIHVLTSWKAISAMLLVLVVLRASADPAPKKLVAERNYTGVVTCVDTNEQIFRIKRSLLPAKQFAYGDKCEITLLYSILKNGVGTSADLRPGEKVTVGYQDSHGVHIADRIEQQPMQFSGTVKELNPERHRLTLRRWILNKRMNIAPDCITVLDGDKACTLDDIHSGDHVVVIYETPGGNLMAWQITKTNAASISR